MGLRTLLGLKKDKRISYLNESYSQEGEDGILTRFFCDKPSGFFVDIGAHHSMRFSNTYKFYKKGWRGINVDAWSGSMEAFKRIRPLDTNLELPIADRVEELSFYVFNEPAFNTFSLALAEEYQQKEAYKIDKTVVMKTTGLEDILNLHLPKDQVIDFLTIDAEGFDYRILVSNNWAKYRPEIVLLESELLIPELIKSDLYDFMIAKDYEFFAKAVRMIFFKNINAIV